jgi:hypothetical protein
MLIINDAATFSRALDSPIDPDLKRLLLMRHDQLLSDTDGAYAIGDLAHFVIVDPSDTVMEIEAGIGFPLITSPAFEWVAHHAGHYEAVTIYSDSGWGIALFVPDQNDVDQTLLSLLRDEASPMKAINNNDGATTAP